MPLSRYLRVVPLPELPGQVLLFSTRTTALIRLPEATLAGLATGALPESGFEPLARMGLLVPDPEAERNGVLGMQDAIDRLSPGVRAAVILGMACNFACCYCYEGSLKGGQAMSDQVASQAVSFLKERFRPGKKRLILDFYGGEPLLYPGRIESMARALRPFVADQGGSFLFTLVTNGSLLTRPAVERLLPLGLASVKVTVDGPPENHNRTRPFRDGRGSFEAILSNLRECCDLVPIHLAGNFTADTYRSFPALLDLLGENGLSSQRLASVKFDAVMAVRDAFAPPEFSGGCAATSEPWLVEASLFLREEILKRGYAHPKLAPASCMVDLADSLTIDWDGSLYKCVTLIGHPDCRAGDVWGGEAGAEAIYHPRHWRGNESCPDCLYLPLCLGGCRYSQYQRGESMAGVDCQKAYFDAALPEMLRQDLAYRVSS